MLPPEASFFIADCGFWNADCGFTILMKSEIDNPNRAKGELGEAKSEILQEFGF